MSLWANKDVRLALEPSVNTVKLQLNAESQELYLLIAGQRHTFQQINGYFK